MLRVLSVGMLWTRMGANNIYFMFVVRLVMRMRVFGRFGFRCESFVACESVLRTRGSTKAHMHSHTIRDPTPSTSMSLVFTSVFVRFEA